MIGAAIRAGLALSLIACGGEPAPADAAERLRATCATAREAPSVERIALRGVVGVPPDREATAASAVAGRIRALRVAEGDSVRAGELIATIDDPALPEQVRVTGATREGARATLANALAARDRARKLVEAGIAPGRDLDDAEARLATARSELETATAQRGLATSQQARASVTAPTAGTVIRVLRQRGALVDGTAATPIVAIADPAVLELRADAPPSDVVRLRVGTPVSVQLDAVPGLAIAGTLVFVSPAVDTATGLGSVRARLDPVADRRIELKLGLSGRIVVEAPVAGRVVIVPAAAVRRSTTGREEVVVCGAGKAEVRPVEVARRTGADVEIVRGIAAGDRVMTSPVLGIEDGTAISIEEPAR